MEELIRILKEIFPDATPYPTSGIQYGVILRQPNGYYKIYEKGTNYEIQAWSYDTMTANHIEVIPRYYIGDYFRKLKDQV